MLGTSGCGGSPQLPAAGAETGAAKQARLLDEAFALQEEATKLLLGISDQKSAEAAAQGLEELKSRTVELLGELKKTGPLAAETKTRISAEIARRKSELQQQVGQFTARLVTQPQLLQSLQPVFDKVTEFRKEFEGFLK